MFKAGDLIVYGSEGVCKVDSIGVPDTPNANGRLFYTLSPMYRSGRVLTPVDTSVFMRPVISKEEAIDIIKSIPDIDAEICSNRNVKMLEDYYRTFLKSHKCSDMVRIIKIVRKKRRIAAENGKRLGQIDERYMKRAEDMLFGEFAVALNIPRDDVEGYIEESIGQAKCS